MPFGSVISPDFEGQASDPFDFLDRAPSDRLPAALDVIPPEDLAFLIYSRSPAQIGEWMRELRPSLLRDVLEQAMRLEIMPREELLPRAQDLAVALRACLGVYPEAEPELALPAEPELSGLRTDSAIVSPEPEPEHEPAALGEFAPAADALPEPELEAVSEEALALSLAPEPSFDPPIELEAVSAAPSVDRRAAPCEVDLSFERPAEPVVEERLPEPEPEPVHEGPLELEPIPAVQAAGTDVPEELREAPVIEPRPEDLYAQVSCELVLAEARPIDAPEPLKTEAPEETQAEEVTAPEAVEETDVQAAEIEAARAPAPVPVPPPFRALQRAVARLMDSPARKRELRILGFLQKESPELATLLAEADYFRLEDQILALGSSEPAGFRESDPDPR